MCTITLLLLNLLRTCKRAAVELSDARILTTHAEAR